MMVHCFYLSGRRILRTPVTVNSRPKVGGVVQLNRKPYTVTDRQVTGGVDHLMLQPLEVSNEQQV